MRHWQVLLCVPLLAGAAEAANILPNPSFETWLGPLPAGWLTSEPLFPGSAVRDSGSHTGTYCVKLVGGDTAAFATSGTVVRAGYDYHFSGFVRAPGVLGGSFILQFTTLTGGAVGGPELLPAYYSGSSYREYERWITAPDSAVLLSVSFATLAGATAYLDDVTVDDTALAGVGDVTVPAVPAGEPARKFVPLTGPARLAPGTVLYDPLGRRVAGRPARGGVYLLPRRRGDDR